MPSGPDAVEKDAEADSISTSSGGSVAGPDVTVIRPPALASTPARQRSSESNRTEPSDEKKGTYKNILNCVFTFYYYLLIDSED